MHLPLKKIEESLKELAELEADLAIPDIAKDQKRYVELSRRHKHLSEISSQYKNYKSIKEDIETARELLSSTMEKSEKDHLEAEAEALSEALAKVEAGILELLLPADPDDDKNVIIEIRGAEGGEEANLFARDLYRMYHSYAAKMGWKLEMLSEQESPMGGYGEVIFLLSGDGVWRQLKNEAGPHRVQRVPDTESQGRVHTSSATVSVLPEADELEVEINEADLEVDVYRSSGPGGQSVNTTDSAVRILHKPTGISVSMQDEKSQLQNRNKALQVLRARIYEVEKERREKERSEKRRGQIKSGGRSDKIRTYNFKENRVTDHRLGITLHKLDRVLAGDMTELIEGMLKLDAEV